MKTKKNILLKSLAISMSLMAFSEVSISANTLHKEKIQGVPQGVGLVSPDADSLDDPPSVLDVTDMMSISAVATQLSQERTWLSQESLSAFGHLSLSLDELFDGVSLNFEKKGKIYKIFIDRVGNNWADFDPANDPYLVFLTHETYSWGKKNKALGFVEGRRKELTEKDIMKMPSFGISLKEVDDFHPLEHGSLAKFDTTISLGNPRLKISRKLPSNFNFKDLLVDNNNLNSSLLTRTPLACESAPTSCNGTSPMCSIGNSYFILTSIKIKDDHEGLFGGSPEIELYPFIDDGTTTVIEENNTKFIFDGRTITDAAGRSRFLPDINSKNLWYSISNGLALYPTSTGNAWSLVLIENDDTTGVIKMDDTRQNRTRKFIFEASYSLIIKQFNVFNFLKSLFNLAKALFSGNGDDLFQDSIGVTNELFCNEGLGQNFPRTFTLISNEWELQGYFTCIDPSCQPLVTSLVAYPTGICDGTAQLHDITANASGGELPYTFTWSGVSSFSGPNENPNFAWGSGWASVKIDSADGQTDTLSKTLAQCDPDTHPF